ncbi:hypothetical protein MATL_G00166630 [Megalops atlanticus]|uniref:Uncharacterized protein n=1 Tax=Megalops atlanticus TaxID=7932 RepID=A0A9D3T6S6_MEGAT|nr:hypothetical protein MATL_G00166630 [Megalops atlanticus]
MFVLLNSSQVLLYGSSCIPLLCDSGEAPLGFLYDLAASLSWEQFGLSGVRCAESHTLEGSLCSEMVYIVDGDLQHSPETVQRAVTEQTLVLFIFIQHRDPFHSQLSDFIASEEVLQRRLDQILLHNMERVKSALHAVLESTLRGLQRRQQAQRKLCSALPVILNSVCSVVTSSSSLDFRTTCLDHMMARDTRELAVRLDHSLRKATEGRFLPSHKCDHSTSAHLETEDISDPGEAKTKAQGDLERMCAVLSHPSQEHPARVCCTGKRLWVEKQDSNPTPSKQHHTRSLRRAIFPLQPSQNPHSPSVHTVPHPSKENQQEDMFWLQEISNMCEWELWGP